MNLNLNPKNTYLPYCTSKLAKKWPKKTYWTKIGNLDQCAGEQNYFLRSN